VGNGDSSTLTITSREGGNAAKRAAVLFLFCGFSLSVSVSVCACGEKACSSEITAGCNGNISSFFAFGVDIGYFDVAAGVEADFTAVSSCGCRLYGPCFNVA
jgi:hypothetical protein